MTLVVILFLSIWPVSFFFVARDFDDAMKKKNLPIRIEDASLQGKVLMFIFSPLFALWILWIKLKFALISLYVYLPHFGKKNDLSKEDLDHMVDEYLKEEDDER